MGNNMGNVSIDNREFSLNIDGKAIFLIAQIILVILKIAGVLNVSWWVIFLPILIPVGFYTATIFSYAGSLCTQSQVSR